MHVLLRRRLALVSMPACTILFMAGKPSNSFLYGDQQADTCDSARMLGHLGDRWVMSAARIA
jgi:hypothetical protein